MTRINMGRRTFLAGASALMLASCGNARNQSDVTESAPEPKAESKKEAAPDPVTESEPDSKTLVVFYSRADQNYPDEWLEVGHTKVMAGYIAEALGASTYEIEPVEAYPEGYDDCCDVAMEEQTADARPAIANPLPDVSSYDRVFIGCPIWWGEEPMIIRTFIEGVDLANKTIVPFTTHGGSGLGSVPSNLQAAIPNAQFLEGLAVAGTEVDGAKDQVVKWAKGLA